MSSATNPHTCPGPCQVQVSTRLGSCLGCGEFGLVGRTGPVLRVGPVLAPPATGQLLRGVCQAGHSEQRSSKSPDCLPGTPALCPSAGRCPSRPAVATLCALPSPRALLHARAEGCSRASDRRGRTGLRSRARGCLGRRGPSALPAAPRSGALVPVPPTPVPPTLLHPDGALPGSTCRGLASGTGMLGMLCWEDSEEKLVNLRLPLAASRGGVCALPA